jgi:Cu+-exporting ATPase
MVRDPVCGVPVNAKQATAKSEYEGQTYYFCSPRCKHLFDQEPERHSKGSGLGGKDLER